MKKRLGYIIAIATIAILIVSGNQFCENKRLENENNEKVRIREGKKNHFKRVIVDSIQTKDYLANISKIALKPHFERIDSINIPLTKFDKEYMVEKMIFDYSKDEYYAIIKVDGEVIGGKSYYSDDRLFKYSFTDTMYSSQINAYEAKHQRLVIEDWNGNTVYPLQVAYDQKRKRAEEAMKKKEEIERAKKRMKFSIDGINVEYAYNEGKSYVYKSSKQLSAEQIVQAIHNIGGNNMNMIQFRDAYGHYADYVYSTQCVIYKSSGVIYKVINGKPVRTN